MSCNSWAPLLVPASSAWKSAALSEAMRKGGFTASVPRAVEGLTFEVGLLPDPHAASTAAMMATLSASLD